jgi:hypothetical protein
VSLRNVRRLVVTANDVPSSPIPVTLLMEALRSFETFVLTRAKRRNIPGDGIPHKYFFLIYSLSTSIVVPFGSLE